MLGNLIPRLKREKIELEKIEELLLWMMSLKGKYFQLLMNK
jgi:hypothetical protein